MLWEVNWDPTNTTAGGESTDTSLENLITEGQRDVTVQLRTSSNYDSPGTPGAATPKLSRLNEGPKHNSASGSQAVRIIPHVLFPRYSKQFSAPFR